MSFALSISVQTLIVFQRQQKSADLEKSYLRHHFANNDRLRMCVSYHLRSRRSQSQGAHTHAAPRLRHYVHDTHLVKQRLVISQTLLHFGKFRVFPHFIALPLNASHFNRVINGETTLALYNACWKGCEIDHLKPLL